VVVLVTCYKCCFYAQLGFQSWMTFVNPLPVSPVKFVDQFRTFICIKRLAFATEKTYCRWVKDFIRFHHRRHPKALEAKHIAAYVSHLVLGHHVSINTQKTALNTLVFLYKRFLSVELGTLLFDYSRRKQTMHAVFSRTEAMKVSES